MMCGRMAGCVRGAVSAGWCWLSEQNLVISLAPRCVTLIIAPAAFLLTAGGETASTAIDYWSLPGWARTSLEQQTYQQVSSLRNISYTKCFALTSPFIKWRFACKWKLMNIKSNLQPLVSDPLQSIYLLASTAAPLPEVHYSCFPTAIAMLCNAYK